MTLILVDPPPAKDGQCWFRLGIMNDDIYETPNVGIDGLYSNYARVKKKQACQFHLHR